MIPMALIIRINLWQRLAAIALLSSSTALLVEVVKLMTPSTGEGRKAYQQLVEIGFVSTPYTAPASPTSN